jgi:hypothetical protein
VTGTQRKQRTQRQKKSSAVFRRLCCDRRFGNPLPTPITPIFAPVAAILSPIPTVFAAVEPIFDAIADAAVVTRVAHVLAPVPNILTAIAPIFAAVYPVLDPIAPPPFGNAGFCDDRYSDRHGEQHQDCTQMHRSGSMSWASAGRRAAPLTLFRPSQTRKV